MRFQRTPERTSAALYMFLVIAAAIAFAGVVTNLGGLLAWVGMIFGYIAPVIYGGIIAFLLTPMMRFFDDKALPALSRGKMKPRVRRVVAILLTMLAVLLILALVLLLVLPRIVASIQDVINRIPAYLRSLQGIYEQAVGLAGTLKLDGEANEILQQILVNINNALRETLSYVGAWLGTLVTDVFAGVAGMVSGIVQGLVGVVISIYLMASRERLFAQVQKVLRAVFPHKANEVLRQIGQDAHRIFNGYLAGAVLDAFCVGVLCFIGMSLFGWEYAMLISVIVGCTNVIPFFGPFIGATPGVLLLLTSNPWHALSFAIFITVLQQIDGNIINPRIVGASIGLPALWVIFGILLFGGLFGVVGMFIGVPLFALVYSVARRLLQYLLIRKGLSVELRDYQTEKNQLQ